MTKLYKDILEIVPDDKDIRINTLPMEVILNDENNKIKAIVTISNSIIPVQESDIEASHIIDGKFYFTSIGDELLVIPVSKSV